MASDPTRYGVFIIESVDVANERLGHLDGENLRSMLDLCGIPCEYVYIRTKLEMEHAAELFEESDLAFIHIACHGNTEELVLTLEPLSFSELEEIFGDALYHRRLFLSACEAGSFDLAKYFVPKHHTYSVVGTPDTIQMDKAALFWSTFYYMMHTTDDKRMNQRELLPTLERITQFFDVKLNYFSIIKNEHPMSHNSLKHFTIDRGVTTHVVRRTPFQNVHRADFQVEAYSSDTAFEDDASN